MLLLLIIAVVDAVVVVDIVVLVHIVAVDPRNRPFNFGQNQISDSWDIDDVELGLWQKGSPWQHLLFCSHCSSEHMWVSGLVKVWCCMEVIATFAIYVVFEAVRILLCLLNTNIKRVDMVWIDFPQLLTFINKWFTGVYSLFKQNRCPCYKTKQLTEFITRLSCFNLMICME